MDYGGGYSDEQLEGLDDFNDETFGSSEPLDEDWQPDFDKNNSILREKPVRNNLPAFFSGQAGEDFQESPLEENDRFYLDGALENEEEHFSASHHSTAYQSSNPSNLNSDYFYFNEQENETNAHFDSQMESMFSLVLDDEDDSDPFLRSSPFHSGYPPSQSYSSPSIWEKTGKDIWSSPNASHPPPSHLSSSPGHYSSGGNGNQGEQQNNPLAKLFGGMIPKQQGGSLPPNSTSVLSLEELEARMKQKSQSVPPPASASSDERKGSENGKKGQEKEEGEEGKEGGVFTADAFPALGAVPVTANKGMQGNNGYGGRNNEKGQGKMNWTPVQRNGGQASSPQVNFTNNPNRQLYSATNVTGSPRSANHTGFPRRDSNPPPFRPRWKENKAMMTAEEIDTIIRMQESQLHAAGTNPFAEDYYHQSLIAKQKQVDGASIPLHKPLFESNAKIIIKKSGIDPLEGVLGRIPSHSVRAPRPLLQIKLDTASSAPSSNDFSSDASDKSEGNVNHSGTKAIQGLLLTIETAYNLLLDIEDIETLLKNAASGSSNYVNPAQLKHKREELTNDLYENLHIFSVPFGTLPQRTQHPEEQPFIYPEDSVLLNISLVQKGKKLIARTLPLLFQSQLINIYNVYMRNLAIFSSSPRLNYDPENSSRLFAYLNNITHLGSISQTIMSLQSILVAHTDSQLIQILQSKFGLNVVQNILKKGHDLGLSFFSRENNINLNALPQELVQLSAGGHHWRETIKTLSLRLRGNLLYVVNSELGQTDKIWEFFAVLVINISNEDKYSLMQELREKIMTTPRNATLNAFLQLASETSFPLPIFSQQSNNLNAPQQSGPTQV